MSNNIPHNNEPISDGSGRVTRAWRAFFASIGTVTQPSTPAQTLTGKNSVSIVGDDVQLVGDEPTPGANQSYSTDDKGKRGWNDIKPTTVNNQYDTFNGVALKGRVADYASLPSSGLAAGDAYLVSEESMIYTWDGSAFEADGEGLSLGDSGTNNYNQFGGGR